MSPGENQVPQRLPTKDMATELLEASFLHVVMNNVGEDFCWEDLDQENKKTILEYVLGCPPAQ